MYLGGGGRLRSVLRGWHGLASQNKLFYYTVSLRNGDNVITVKL